MWMRFSESSWNNYARYEFSNNPNSASVEYCEGGKHRFHMTPNHLIRNAFEQAGVAFIDENGGGPG